MDVWRINTEIQEIEIITLKLKSYGEVESNGKFQFGPLLWVLNLIGNNAFRRGVQMNPLLNPLMVQSLRLYHFYCPNERKDNENDTSINVEIP